MATSNDLLLERREFKYLIPTDLVPHVRHAALTTCRHDRYGGADGTYLVRSLYLDTSRHDLFWANEREAPDRYKARIRSYPGTASPVFLEIKRRVLDSIVKTRAPVPAGRWRDIVRAPTAAAFDGLEPRVKRPLEGFLVRVHTQHLQPTLLVEYVREAYMSEVDEYARLTFDTRITCQTHHELTLDANPRRWRFVTHPSRTVMEPAHVVLELKFGRTIPAWMLALIRRFSLIRYSFSKYGYGLRSQLTLPELRVASTR